MKQELLVSIIINNYNYARYVRTAIDSALGQTYSPVEIIVVDDGSTDISREMIASYGHPLIPILKENGGQASAFNAGFARSRGEIVIFLDSDDALLPGIVRRVAETFHDNPDMARVQYRMEVVDTNGNRTGTIKPARHLPMRSGDLRRQVLTFPFDMTWSATSGNAFAARVLHQIFPVPERIYGRVGADWYLSHLAPLFGPVTFLDDIGAYYRVHGSNNYELSTAAISLAHVRQSITYSYHTLIYIKKFANQLGLDGRPDRVDDILSVSYIVNRMISLKLDPPQHPITGDRIWKLVLLGVIASFRRFDVSLPMKCLFILWFLAMAPAPRPVARWLAERFLFPETRSEINKLLRFLHRTQPIGD